MKFNNILKVILLSKFCLCSAFISNLHIKKSNLKLNAIDNPASIISKFGVGNEWTYNQFLDKINNNEIDGVSILSDEKGLAVIDKLHTDDILSNNIHYIKILPNMINDIIIQLNSHHITYDILKIPESDGFDISLPLKFVGTYVIGVLVINVLLSLFRGNKSPFDRNSINNENFDPFNFNKHTNLVDTELLNSSFDDVAGCDEAKNELMEVVDFLKNPKKYEEAGAKIPKGILLEGEPGTGKTLLARAVAGEAGVSFLSASGSEFIEMFVGVGASRVRKLFDNARKNSPCVIFIDEIDAVGRQRGAGINSGNDEREQTLNQILTNMDGFTASTGIIVLAATNRADILDDALLRPGRFDRKINVPLPDLEGRKEIFRVHTRDKKLDNNTDINEIAILTTGFSGADICNLANEAAILSVRNNRTRIDRQTILDAYEKITIGLPSLKNTEDESVVKLVSYHEIGHAFMVKYFEEFFDLRKVTINANKGGAGGYTLFTPKQRFMSYPTKKYMLANLVIALGGRAAEVHLYSDNKNRDTDVVFKEIKNLDITTGASNDLKQADNIARKYIQLFGLSDDSSLVNNNVESSSQPFLGRELALGGDRISEYSKEKTDKMVCKLITDCYRIALNLIDANPKNFNKLAEKLIKERTLDASDFENLKFKY